MAARTSIEIDSLLGELLQSPDSDVLRKLSTLVANELMSHDADHYCGATYGERTDARQNSRNGYRERRWDTRVGSLELNIPKLRSGSYFPDWLLTRRTRAEDALISVVTQSYLRGVSTRRMEKLLQALGIANFSKSEVSEMAASLDEDVAAFRSRPLENGPYPFVIADATVVKVREDHRTVNVHVLYAIGVNGDGKREILGCEVSTQEDGAGWLAFFRSLVTRGLRGVVLVISDDHSGLKSAIAAALPGASWQRCRTHYVRRILSIVPKSSQPWVTTLIHSIFDQPDAAHVFERFDQVVETLEEKLPKAAEHLRNARDELLAFTAFPPALWKRLWTSNAMERTNAELKRRTRVVGVFPNRDAIIRLVGALLADIHDTWECTNKTYMLPELLSLCKQTMTEKEDATNPIAV